MKIAVSACLMGCNCKYNGKNNKDQELIDALKEKEVIPICPEMAAGLGAPRPCVELKDGIAIDENGNNVDEEYKKGVEITINRLKQEDIELVILQSRSPTCGVKQIYDGSFSKRLIAGKGQLTTELIKNGYKVMDVEDFHLGGINYEN